MKKIFFLAFAIFCCLTSVLASDFDLIIKTNSEKIEALIQEVSDTEIRYKQANDPNGPLFILSTEEVASIIYANGEVQAIEPKAQPVQQPRQNYSFGMYASEPGMMQRIGYNEYIIDGQRLRGKELVFFLNKNCPPAYNYYKKWNSCEIAGWCFMPLGLALASGIGVSCFLIGNSKKEGYRITYTGIAFMAIGGAMTVASIPMIACGNVNKRAVASVYNEQCGNKSHAADLRLNVISGANGLGLALGF